MSLLELAERCERAEGPDRELDAAIMTAFTDERGCRPIWMLHAKTATGARGTFEAPRFTACLDAALTLVPEGWGYTAAENPDQPGRHLWGLWRHDGTDTQEGSEATTPALALCAAALRARTSQETQP